MRAGAVADEEAQGDVDVIEEVEAGAFIFEFIGDGGDDHDVGEEDHGEEEEGGFGVADEAVEGADGAQGDQPDAAEVFGGGIVKKDQGGGGEGEDKGPGNEVGVAKGFALGGG